MLDVIPRRFVPSRVPEGSRKDLVVLLSCIVCLTTGFILARCGRAFPPPPLWTTFLALRQIVHPASIPCPFCGGTRAFLAACRGDFVESVRWNFSGLLSFLWLCVNLPLRALLLGAPPGLRIGQLRRLAQFLDRTDLQMGLLFVPWIAQRALTLAW